MNSLSRAVAAAALIVASVPFAIQPASAGVGDLLVAPTRLVLSNADGTVQLGFSCANDKCPLVPTPR